MESHSNLALAVTLDLAHDDLSKVPSKQLVVTHTPSLGGHVPAIPSDVSRMYTSYPNSVSAREPTWHHLQAPGSFCSSHFLAWFLLWPPTLPTFELWSFVLTSRPIYIVNILWPQTMLYRFVNLATPKHHPHISIQFIVDQLMNLGCVLFSKNYLKWALKVFYASYRYSSV